MAPFGFGKKQSGEPERPFITDVIDEDDLEEVLI